LVKVPNNQLKGDISPKGVTRSQKGLATPKPRTQPKREKVPPGNSRGKISKPDPKCPTWEIETLEKYQDFKAQFRAPAQWPNREKNPGTH